MHSEGVDAELAGGITRYGREDSRPIKDPPRTSELDELVREKGSHGFRRRPNIEAEMALLEIL